MIYRMFPDFCCGIPIWETNEQGYGPPLTEQELIDLGIPSVYIKSLVSWTESWEQRQTFAFFNKQSGWSKASWEEWYNTGRILCDTINTLWQGTPYTLVYVCVLEDEIC